MAKRKKSVKDKTFDRWYNTVGKRLFDDNGYPRSKKWMRTIYNDLRGQTNPATQKPYTSKEAFAKIANRREFKSAENLGAQNLVESVFEADPKFKRKVKGGRFLTKNGKTYIQDNHGRIYEVFWVETSYGSPYPDYRELFNYYDPNKKEDTYEKYDRIMRERKERKEFFDSIGGVDVFYREGTIIR